MARVIGDGGGMLSVYVPRGGRLERVTVEPGALLPDEAIWLDLVAPTVQEDRAAEQFLGISVPTREEMQEIEVSSRLYVENGARYMTATLMCNSDSDAPRTTPVTFILSHHRLATVRYEQPRPFALVEHKLARSSPSKIAGDSVLLDLLDAVIDRSADILERVGGDVDGVSRLIFESEDSAPPVYNDVLKKLGRTGDLTSKVRESLVSIGRVLSFLANESEGLKWGKETRTQLQSMQRDVVSLTDHASYIGNKVTFLLDAMLGVVNLQQNAIIKIFSVAAVVLMPPTLVASIYGMNFKHMPELEWPYGYPMALVIMLLAAIVPYMYFKWRKWL
jgi:magnesium transporter